MTSASTLLIILAAAAALLPLAYVVHLSRHKKSSGLPARLVGRLASVEHSLSPEGFVLLDGELWAARTRTGESVGRGRSNVRVVGARGHQLEVEPTGSKPGPVCGTRTALGNVGKHEGS